MVFDIIILHLLYLQLQYSLHQKEDLLMQRVNIAQKIRNVETFKNATTFPLHLILFWQFPFAIRYAIYALSTHEARNDAWIENAALVVVCGNVGNEIGNQIIDYILRGGKLLALCSDVIHILLPSFKTAEVRENELVHFSYGKWKHVRMMHHIFCYQASPVRTRFSQDHEDVK